MLITAEQQQALIDNFIKQGCNAEQLDGFEQGMNAMLGLIERITNGTPIPITFSISEIREPLKHKGSFNKEIVLSQTKKQ